jgi:energy-coupling factor transport system permease protein
MSRFAQYIPGSSLFHRLDPRSKILFMLLVASLVFLLQSLWVTGGVLVALLVLWFVARLPLSLLRQLGKAALSVVLFLFVVQALFYPGETILIHPLIPHVVPLVGGMGRITLEGILFALLVSMRLLAMVIIMPLISLTTPLYLFTLGLVRMGLPYRLAYTMTAAFNLIPILAAEIEAITEAQRLRAFQVFEKGNFVQKLRAYPTLVTPLVIGAMRRAQLIAVAMDSRAFGATTRRTYIEDIRMELRDWIFVGLTTLGVVAAAGANYLLS